MSELLTSINEFMGPMKTGPLSGKRFLVRPNMSVRGQFCEAGSRALENYIALEDATVVARLTDNGAQLFRSSQMTELGFGLAGDMTAKGIPEAKADFALISDAMGEARMIAADAGLFGFKPSWGIVSRFGLIGLVPSMECCGVAAASLKDICLVMEAIAGKDERDPSLPDDEVPDFSAVKTAEGPVRAGVIREMTAHLSENERAAFAACLEKLKKAGLEVIEESLPDFELFRKCHQIIASTEASSSAGKFDGVRYGYRAAGAKNWNDMYLNTRGEIFGPLIKSFLFQGAYFQFENYTAFENACRIRRRLVLETERLLAGVDVLVSPVRVQASNHAPATVSQVYDAFAFTLPDNLTGSPALFIPMGDRGGVQLAARRLGDDRLLAIAMRLSSKPDGGTR